MGVAARAASGIAAPVRASDPARNLDAPVPLIYPQWAIRSAHCVLYSSFLSARAEDETDERDLLQVPRQTSAGNWCTASIRGQNAAPAQGPVVAASTFHPQGQAAAIARFCRTP